MEITMLYATMVLWLAAAVPDAGMPTRDARLTADCAHEIDRISAADLPRPTWASDEVPELVWRLVETAAIDEDDDRRRCLLKAAEREVRAGMDSTSIAGRYATAVILGVRANTEGGRTKLRAASVLYEELNAILEVAPDHPRARHMLGRLHAAVCRMNGATRWLAANLLGGDVLRRASWAEAEQHLAFAERAAPEVIDHHLQLANLYRDTGRLELAHEELLHALNLPSITPTDLAVRAEVESGIRDVEHRLAVR